MPNHLTTTMRVTGPADLVATFRDTHIVPDLEGHRFDFDTLIPRPAILDGIVSGGRTDFAVEALTGKTLAELALAKNPDDAHAKMVLGIQSWVPRDPTKHAQVMAALTPDDLAQGQLALQAIAETGYPTWYEWSLANWGTKWNSYSFALVLDSPGEFVCRYDTAWSPPIPIWERLAATYPGLAFTVDSYDEGGGFAIHGEARDGAWQVLADVGCDAESYQRAYGHPPDVHDDEDDDVTGLPVM